MTRPLTDKEEKFAQLLASGKEITQSDAYRQVYSVKNMANKTIWENASRIADRSKVKARIAELKAKVEEKFTDKVVYDKEIAFKNFDKMLKDLSKQIVACNEIDDTKARIHTLNALTETFRKLEEQKAKLFHLYNDNNNTNVFVGNLTIDLDEDE